MNGLSWLLYFADVSEGIRLLATFGWIIAGLAVAGAIGFWINVEDNSPHDKEAQEAASRVFSKTFWSFLPLFLISITLFTAIPQRQTFMLIAASEFGESILDNEDIQAIGGEAGDLAVDSMRFLREYINDQLPSDTEK